MDDRWRALRARMAFEEASSFADVTFFLDLLVFFTLLFFDIVFVQFIGIRIIGSTAWIGGGAGLRA